MKTDVTGFVEENWDELIQTMQSLIQSFPQYDNIEGLNEAASIIEKYLERSNIDSYELSYTNTTFDDHGCYVPVEEFGSSFAEDRNRIKKNIISIIDSGKPGKTLILNGHYDVDTVSTPELWNENKGWKAGEVRGDLLLGRGATDMIGGLCSFLLVSRFLKNNKEKWSGKVIFTAVCDEEVGGNSTLKTLLWLKEKGHIDNKAEAFISEPSDGLVCNESLGFFHVQMVGKRPSVHMGVAGPENNALNDIIGIISNFSEIVRSVCDKLDRNNSVEKVIYNWGVISGGHDAAIPLGRVDAEGVIFLPEVITKDSFQMHLLEEIKNISNGTVDISFSSFHFDGAISQESLLDEVLLDPNFFPSGYATKRGLFPSPCDARLFKSFGVPVTVYGPGSLAQAHTVDEFIDLKNVRTYIEHIIKCVPQYLND